MCRLALTLKKSIREIEAMDSVEISQWIAYDRKHTLPDPWLQHGILCATLANLWSKSKHKPEDFIPKLKKKPTPKQLFARFKACAVRQPSEQ